MLAMSARLPAPCADSRQVLSEMVELLAAEGKVEMDVEQVFARSQTSLTLLLL